MKSRRD